MGFSEIGMRCLHRSHHSPFLTSGLRQTFMLHSYFRRTVAWKHDPKSRSHAQLAIQFNATTQQTDEVARNGKTEANAGLSSPAGRSPVKLIKYLLVLLRVQFHSQYHLPQCANYLPARPKM